MKQFVVLVILFIVGFNMFSIDLNHCDPMVSSDKSNRMDIYSTISGEFPIVASTVFNSRIGPTVEGLENIKECGFNLCRHSASISQFEKLLEYMKNTGLKIIMHNSSFEVQRDDKDSIVNWENNLLNFVNQFKDNPLVFGWQLKDEPKWADLSEFQKRYKILRETDKSHLILVNLVGELSGPYTGPCKTLPSYLDSIQKKFDLDVWSSDNYPIMIKNGELIVHYQEFFNNLEAFSNKSRETGIPMWSYCESMEYSTIRYARPAATVPYLSFQIFSALAYGAQGIVYWTYWQRPSTKTQTYLSALVDLDGNKTESWYAAKKINSQIKAFSSVFLGATVEECYHTGEIQMKNTLPYIENTGPIEKLSNEKEGVLASILKNKDKKYLIVVNHSIKNLQKIKIKFLSGYKVVQLQVSSSDVLERKLIKRKSNVTLEPGGYIIYEWN